MLLADLLVWQLPVDASEMYRAFRELLNKPDSASINLRAAVMVLFGASTRRQVVRDLKFHQINPVLNLTEASKFPVQLCTLCVLQAISLTLHCSQT